MAQITNALFPQPREPSRLLAFTVLSRIALVNISSAIAAIFVSSPPRVRPNTDQDQQDKLDQIRDAKTVIFLNRDKYSEEWVDGERNGQGKHVFAHGDVYNGEWVLGKIHGQGKHVYADGSVYDGEWVLGKIHGKGKFISATGNVYDGDWVDSQKNGPGKCVYADGSVYDGEWVLGKIHGKGKFISATGNVYDGDWVDSQENGPGKCVYADGSVYDGEWVLGKKHGLGKYTYHNGDYIRGKWHQSSLLEITDSEVTKTLLFATNSIDSDAGGFPLCASSYLSEILQTVGLIKQEHSILLAKVAKALEFSPKIDVTQITSSIQNRDLTIIPAGWKEHAVVLVFYKDHLLICNRGQGAKDCSTKKFRIRPDLLSVNQINRIIQEKGNSYEKAEKYLYKELPDSLGASTDEEDRKLEIGLSTGGQQSRQLLVCLL